MVMAVSLVSSGRRAVVSSVSTTCYRRRALVPAVSRGQCECVVMAFNVLISSCCRAGRERVRPARQKPPISLHVGLLGESFRENAAGVRLLGELFRARGLKCLVLGEWRRAHCCRILILGSCASFRACAASDAVWTWLADAIEHVARQQGVDIESPTWE